MSKQILKTGPRTFRLEGTQMEVESILSSNGSIGYIMPPTLHTLRLRYPRIIHAEIMTHRVFGRNARSSRAVPIKKMMEEIEANPFVPWHWGRNRPGMQADEECNEFIRYRTGEKDWTREQVWKIAARDALRHAAAFHDAGYHKQVVNRLLEPFMYIDVLITSTDWKNFLWLRDHKDAEPHLQDLARMVDRALNLPIMQGLYSGEWHLPYITDRDRIEISEHLFFENGHHQPTQDQIDDYLRRLSAARCARISYVPFDGEASIPRELERYDMLVRSDRVHASPLEHQATPDRPVIISSDIFYEPQGDLSPDETLDARNGWLKEELHGNLTGWIQGRKLVPNEAVKG